MVRAKRPYVPKVRGCYECSQRRIHCDRTRPTCAKCSLKGIQCSGFGIRYRFNNDPGSKQSKYTTFNQIGSAPSGSSYIVTLGSGTIACPGEVSAHSEFLSRASGSQIVVDDRSNVLTHRFRSYSSSSSQCSSSERTRQSFQSPPSCLPYAACIAENSISVPTNMIEMIEPWKQFLMDHFSQNIAPEMVVIDDVSNGWRNMILPVAQHDELVREAVLSAAAFHFTSAIKSQYFNPRALYARTIGLLHQRQDLKEFDAATHQCVLLALLVLLVTVMVNGSSDFPTICHMLESALAAVGGEEVLMNGELGYFLLRQIRKLRGYAAPMLSKDGGMSRLRLTVMLGLRGSNGWDCFNSYFSTYHDRVPSMSLISRLQQLACNIYTTRALHGSRVPPQSQAVADFIKTLRMIPPDAPGQHTLVFSTVLAAAESTLPEDQQYFREILWGHYKRNGFVNILRGIDFLERIWSEPVKQDWTETLPNLQVFIV